MTLHHYVTRSRGRQAMLALTLGVSPSLISMYASGMRRVPVARCLEIERATRGLVRAGGLRKDVSFKRRP